MITILYIVSVKHTNPIFYSNITFRCVWLCRCVCILWLLEENFAENNCGQTEMNTLYHRDCWAHGLSCRSEGRHPRHSALNDIDCSLSSAHIPSRCEPSGIYCSDGKARWHFIGALEARKGLCLGCNMPGHICTFTSSKCSNVFWRCSTAGGTGQEGKVCLFGWKPPLCPGGCEDIRSVGPRGPPIALGPRTPPQGGNWGTKVLPISPPASVRGCAAREHGGCCGISQGILD